MKPEDQAAFNEAISCVGEGLAIFPIEEICAYFFEQGMAHRDAQPAVAVDEQLLRAAKKYFVNYCLDEASEFFAEDTGCRQEQHDDAVELREAIAAAEAAKGGEDD